MRINIELNTGDKNDVRALQALVAALGESKYAPPEGLVISKPSAEADAPIVTVWAPEGKEAEAAANMSVEMGVEVKHESTDEAPKPKAEKPKAEKPKPEPEAPEPEADPEAPKVDVNAVRAELRALLVEASSLPGVAIDDAKQLIADAAGVATIGELKPELAPKAIEALKTFIAEKRGE